MANGLNSIVKRESGGGKMGSRRIFTAHFKLQVLDSYRSDSDCKGNQRATARKYGIHRRQIQKWLQAEKSLRTSVGGGGIGGGGPGGDATLDCARQGGAHACSAISRENNATVNAAAATPNNIHSSQQQRDAFNNNNNNKRLLPSAPMDLTVRKSPEISERLSSSSTTQVLDLTCRKRPVPEVSSSTAEPPSDEGAPPPTKTFKLFKPYLLDDKMAVEVSKSPAVVTTPATQSVLDPWQQFGGSAFYPLDCYGGFSSAASYNTSYSYYPTTPIEQQVRYSPCYDSSASSSYSPGSCYDDDHPSLSPDSERAAARQRHSYLDFNMATVDSYYHHRRQVSPITKWGKQDLFSMRCRLEASPPLT